MVSWVEEDQKDTWYNLPQSLKLGKQAICKKKKNVLKWLIMEPRCQLRSPCPLGILEAL